jgi:hypothetical protein
MNASTKNVTFTFGFKGINQCVGKIFPALLKITHSVQLEVNPQQTSELALVVDMACRRNGKK